MTKPKAGAKHVNRPLALVEDTVPSQTDWPTAWWNRPDSFPAPARAASALLPEQREGIRGRHVQGADGKCEFCYRQFPCPSIEGLEQLERSEAGWAPRSSSMLDNPRRSR